MAATDLETARTLLRRFTEDDAAFVLELVNDEAFLRHIGDRGVRTLDDARAYIRGGPLASYRTYGYGPFLVELRETGQAIGLCGYYRRDALEHPDLGFAFLRPYRGQGLGYECAAWALGHGFEVLDFERVVAMVSPGNHVSQGLLRKLGFVFERQMRMSADADEVALFTVSRPVGMAGAGSESS